MADGTVIQIENPLLTQSRGMTLWSELRRLPAYMPSDVKWRGNPCVQPGDILQFEATSGNVSRHIVTTHKMHFAGGFYIDSSSVGSPITLKEINAQTTRDKELNQITSDVEEKVAEATGDLEQAVAALESRVEAMERTASSLSADVDTAVQDAADAAAGLSDARSRLTSLENRATALERTVPIHGSGEAPLELSFDKDAAAVMCLRRGSPTPVLLYPGAGAVELDGYTYTLTERALSVSGAAAATVDYTIFWR